jgi:hypothetical protein
VNKCERCASRDCPVRKLFHGSNLAPSVQNDCLVNHLTRRIRRALRRDARPLRLGAVFFCLQRTNYNWDLLQRLYDVPEARPSDRAARITQWIRTRARAARTKTRLLVPLAASLMLVGVISHELPGPSTTDVWMMSIIAPHAYIHDWTIPRKARGDL